MLLNLSDRGGNADRQMNRILCDMVQVRTNSRFTDLIEMIAAHNNHRPVDSTDAKNYSLFRRSSARPHFPGGFPIP